MPFVPFYFVVRGFIYSTRFTVTLRWSCDRWLGYRRLLGCVIDDQSETLSIAACASVTASFMNFAANPKNNTMIPTILHDANVIQLIYHYLHLYLYSPFLLYLPKIYLFSCLQDSFFPTCHVIFFFTFLFLVVCGTFLIETRRKTNFLYFLCVRVCERVCVRVCRIPELIFRRVIRFFP